MILGRHPRPGCPGAMLSPCADIQRQWLSRTVWPAGPVQSCCLLSGRWSRKARSSDVPRGLRPGGLLSRRANARRRLVGIRCCEGERNWRDLGVAQLSGPAHSTIRVGATVWTQRLLDSSLWQSTSVLHTLHVEEHLEEACGAFLPGCVWCPFASVVADEAMLPNDSCPWSYAEGTACLGTALGV